MTDNDRSLSFSRELAGNLHARTAYDRMTPPEKCRVLARAGRMRSQEALHLLAMSLSDETQANEYF